MAFKVIIIVIELMFLGTHLFVQILTHLKVGFKTRLKVRLTHPYVRLHLKVCFLPVQILTHLKVGFV